MDEFYERVNVTLRPRQDRGEASKRRGEADQAAPLLHRGQVSASRHTSLCIALCIGRSIGLIGTWNCTTIHTSVRSTLPHHIMIKVRLSPELTCFTAIESRQLIQLYFNHTG